MADLALIALAYVTTVFFVVFILTPGFKRPQWGPLWFGVLVAWMVMFYDGMSGTPKDIGTEWRDLENSQIVSYSFLEPEDIYIWLIRPDTYKPTAYRMDFERSLARKLGEATFTKRKDEALYLREGEGGVWGVRVDHPEPITEEPPKP